MSNSSIFQNFGEHHLFTPAEWLVKFRNPFGEYGQLKWEPSFFTNELEFYMLALLTYIHAYRHGGRYLWLWWTTIAHGLTTECVSYWMEPIDNFWHSQSTFMWFGQREPLHIMCLYPGFIYTAAIAVERLGVSEICEACAMGLFVVLFDIPYDIVGVKLLWWTWHDTDANIRDRHYWVPWTSYYFHMTFACAFNLIYNRSRRHFVGKSSTYSNDAIQTMSFAQQRVSENWWGEFKALLVTGLFSMPFGIVQFIPGYHAMKDIFDVHAEVTTCILGFIYATVLMYGLQHGKPINTKEIGEREEGRGIKKGAKGSWHYDEVFMCVIMHYMHYVILVTFMDPANKQVLGLHQPMGSSPGSGDIYDCAQTRNLSYPYPFTPVAFPPFMRSDVWEVSVWKRPYLCPNGEELFDEAYYDFHCPKAQAQEWIPGTQWFWICGTDWNDSSGITHVEYCLVIYAIAFIGIITYTNALCYPRNFYEQFFVLGEFPKYYKIHNPKKVLTAIEHHRIGPKGTQEYKVKYGDVTTGKEEPSKWVERNELELDGAGQVYGERGGLYGVLHDTYSTGSTRDRLRTYDAYKHATDRLGLYETRDIRRHVSGISYVNGIPQAAGDSTSEEQAFQARENVSKTSSGIRRRR